MTVRVCWAVSTKKAKAVKEVVRTVVTGKAVVAAAMKKVRERERERERVVATKKAGAV